MEAEIELPAQEASNREAAKGGMVRAGIHPPASFSLRPINPVPASFRYTPTVPALAGTFAAAELQTTRAYEVAFLEACIFQFAPALNLNVAPGGWLLARRGVGFGKPRCQIGKIPWGRSF